MRQTFQCLPSTRPLEATAIINMLYVSFIRLFNDWSWNLGIYCATELWSCFVFHQWQSPKYVRPFSFEKPSGNTYDLLREAICVVTGHLSKHTSPAVHNGKGEDEPGIGVNHPVPTLQHEILGLTNLGSFSRIVSMETTAWQVDDKFGSKAIRRDSSAFLTQRVSRDH